MTEIEAVDQWRSWIREALVAAMRERRAAAVRALRSALSAIDNAEAVDVREAPRPGRGPIAGALTGVGTAEVPRRQLTGDEVRAILGREIEERRAAAEDYDGAGRKERAGELRDEATEIERLMTRDQP